VQAAAEPVAAKRIRTIIKNTSPESDKKGRILVL
jgi:hypothetical protein